MHDLKKKSIVQLNQNSSFAKTDLFLLKLERIYLFIHTMWLVVLDLLCDMDARSTLTIFVVFFHRFALFFDYLILKTNSLSIDAIEKTIISDAYKSRALS